MPRILRIRVPHQRISTFSPKVGPEVVIFVTRSFVL